MARFRSRWTVLTLALALSLLLVSATSTLAAAGPPKTQVVEYTYDGSAGTFTLYTATSSGGLTWFTGATLEVDGGAVRTDAGCVYRFWESGGILWGDSTCVFVNVTPPTKTLKSTAAFENPPTESDTNTYVGAFSHTCRQTSSRDCAGQKTVRMTAPR